MSAPAPLTPSAAKRSRRAGVLALLLALAALACATPAPKPAPAEPLLPLPRSSIAAVLANRGELGLSLEQVRSLEERDAMLERQNAPLLEELQSLRAPKKAADSRATGMERGSQGQPGSGKLGRNGARGSGSMGGGRMRPEGPAGEAPGPGAEALHQKLDDNDTAAYLEAELLLTEAQRPRAREVASRYREQVFERRRRSE